MKRVPESCKVCKNFGAENCAETEYDSVCVHFCDETKENALETTSGANKSYCNGWFNQ